MVHDGPRRLVAVARDRHGKVFRHRIVADDQQRARPAIATDDGEIAGGILAVERIEEQHPAGIGVAGNALQCLARRAALEQSVISGM